MADNAPITSPDIGRVPFTEAIEALEKKSPMTTRAWDDMIDGEHGRVFTIAGATKVDMVNDMQKAILDIRKRGGTKREFVEQFREISARYGWEYNGDESWRARIIFETNQRTANAAGRWQQIQRRQAALKRRDPNATLYLAYRVLDNNLARRRLEHQQWKTIILPADHSWWLTHYPPNGWGCACTVRVLTQRYMDANGLKVTAKPPKLNRTERINPTTGEVYRPTPQGIDVGFDHNHGEQGFLPSGTNMVNSQLGTKLAQVNVDSNDFAMLLAGQYQGGATVGFFADGVADLLKVKTSRVSLSATTAAKLKAAGNAIAIDDARLLPLIVNQGLIVRSGADVISIFFVGRKIYRAIIKPSAKGGALNLTRLERINKKQVNDIRAGGQVIREAI